MHVIDNIGWSIAIADKTLLITQMKNGKVSKPMLWCVALVIGTVHLHRTDSPIVLCSVLCTHAIGRWNGDGRVAKPSYNKIVELAPSFSPWR